MQQISTAFENLTCVDCCADLEYHPHDNLVPIEQCKKFGGHGNRGIRIRDCDFCSTTIFCNPEVCYKCAEKYPIIQECTSCEVNIAAPIQPETIAKNQLEKIIPKIHATMQLMYNEVVIQGVTLSPDFEFPVNNDNVEYLHKLCYTIQYLSGALKWNI